MTGVFKKFGHRQVHQEGPIYVKTEAGLRVRHQKLSDVRDSSKPPELGGRNRKDHAFQLS